MKYLEYRSYPKMYIPEDATLDYLRGIECALRFILSIDLQCVSLTGVEALDHVEEMQEALIESMEVNE